MTDGLILIIAGTIGTLVILSFYFFFKITFSNFDKLLLSYYLTNILPKIAKDIVDRDDPSLRLLRTRDAILSLLTESSQTFYLMMPLYYRLFLSFYFGGKSLLIVYIFNRFYSEFLSDLKNGAISDKVL